MVAPLTIREINMVHEARTLIEPFAILHYGNKISDEIYQNYFRIFQRDTANVSDLNEYYETDKQFHQMFIDATSNDYLISTYERIAQQNTRLRIYSGRKSRNRLLASQQEHLKYVEYCLKQDCTRFKSNGRTSLSFERSFFRVCFSRRFYDYIINLNMLKSADSDFTAFLHFFYVPLFRR